MSFFNFIFVRIFQEAQADLDQFNHSVQNLACLSQSIARESGDSNASTEMNSLLQICFDKLNHVQEYLPMILKRNKILLGHLQKYDDGLAQCEQWISEANERLERYSVDTPDLNEHRVSLAKREKNPTFFFRHFEEFLFSTGILSIIDRCKRQTHRNDEKIHRKFSTRQFHFDRQ